MWVDTFNSNFNHRSILPIHYLFRISASNWWFTRSLNQLANVKNLFAASSCTKSAQGIVRVANHQFEVDILNNYSMCNMLLYIEFELNVSTHIKQPISESYPIC